MSSTRRPGVIAAIRRALGLENTAGADNNRPRLRHRSIFADLVEKMTNHERSIWAREGYPGLRNHDIKLLLPYAQKAQERLNLGHGRSPR